MRTKDAVIERVHIDAPIYLTGLSLAASGLPAAFESLGKLWDVFHRETLGRVPEKVQPEVEIAVMTETDYIVGSQISGIKDANGLTTLTIPAGEYVKGSFSADSFGELVDEQLQTIWEDMVCWARERDISLAESFSVEVYPQDAVKLERPEMYCLCPIEGNDL